MSEYASAVLVKTLSGKIPMVRDPRQVSPIYWKPPGGTSKKNERSEETAVRELKEETGIFISSKILECVHWEPRRDHMFFLFRCTLNYDPEMKLEGDGKEEMQLFSPEEVHAGAKRGEVHPQYYEMIKHLI